MPTLKTYSKVQRVVEYSTIFSDPVALKRNFSDDSLASSIGAPATAAAQPLSSTLKHPEQDKRLVFKPYDSNVSEAASKDGSRTSAARGRKKAPSKPAAATVKLFTSDGEDEDAPSVGNTKCQTDTLTENSENSVPVATRSRTSGRLKKTQSASEIGAGDVPKLKSAMKKPTVKKTELKSKLKKKADLHLVEVAAQKPEPIVEEAAENAAAVGKGAKTTKSAVTVAAVVENDENEKMKKPAKRGPRVLEIINDKNDQLKDVVCDNKTKYTTTTSTPQFRRRKLKINQDLSVIYKTESPAAAPAPAATKK